MVRSDLSVDDEVSDTKRSYCLTSVSGSRSNRRKRVMAGSLFAILVAITIVSITVTVTALRKGSGDNDNRLNRYAREKDPAFWHGIATDELHKALHTALQRGVAKNVILFLGDGMGPTSVTASRILAGQMKGGKGEEYELTFDRFPHTGLSKTYNVDTQTTDSAASGTAFLTGVKTNQGLLGLGAKTKLSDCASSKGNELDSIVKWFADDGRPTGIVTTMRVTHATPAAAYAHSADRYWETDGDIPKDQRQCDDIAKQLVTKNSFINVVMGGGRTYFKPTTYTDPKPSQKPAKGKRQDGRDLIQEWLDEKAQRNVTHAYVTNKEELQKVSNNTQYLFGLFSPSHMDYVIESDKNVQPSLAEMTTNALRLLQANTKGSKGFFLLVEGGLIDHGHHSSSAIRALNEVVAFSEAVGAAVDMTDIKDTLIVVTADHSHVMGISGYPARGNPILGKATLEKAILNTYLIDKMPWTTILYGNGPGYHTPRENLTNVDTESKDYIQQSAVPITEETHGGEDVTIYARGPQSFLYTGVHEQNYIPILMAYASCVGPFAEGKKPCAAQTTQSAVQDMCIQSKSTP